jgi:hypothetical protein
LLISKKARQFQTIEKAIQQVEKDAVKPRKYRSKKSNPSTNKIATAIDYKGDKLVQEKTAPNSPSVSRESITSNQEMAAKVE